MLDALREQSRGVSSIRLFYSRRLVVPQSEHRCEGTPLLFSAPVAVAFGDEARKE